MFREKLRIYSLINLVVDLLMLVLSFFIGYLIIWGHIKANFPQFFIKINSVLIICWIIVSYLVKLYEPKRFEYFEKSFTRHFQSILIHAMLVATAVFMIEGFAISRILFIYGYAIFIILDTLLRLGLIQLLKRERESGINSFRVIVVGNGQIGRHMYEVLRDYTGYGFKPLGIFDDKQHDSRWKLNGNIADAKKYALENKVDEIFCALPLAESEKINDLLNFSEDNLIRFKIVPDFSAFNNRMISIDFYGFMPVISLRPEPLNNVFNRMLKRGFDILFSLVVCVCVLSWLIPLVALFVKLNSKGPVFYLQNRSGRNYELFKCIKFRTMTVTESDKDFVQTKKDDPRITSVGRFLRKYNIDELPQFINVLIGNMSVVGPRPHVTKLTQIYRPLVEKYMIRHLALPGITGLAQVRGFRGETADPESMHNRVVADVFYIENWSFILDVKIILITLWNMVKGEKNAY